MNILFNKTKYTHLLSALIGAATILAANAGPLKPGDTFPELSKFGIEGALPDTKGKVVLVDFFASWCGPCKDSFPVMQELHRTYADKGLIIVGINLDKKKADMEEFLKRHPVDFSIVRDGANRLVSEIKIPTMPTSFLLDREGKVRSIHRGFKGAETGRNYAQEIEALLK